MATPSPDLWWWSTGRRSACEPLARGPSGPKRCRTILCTGRTSVKRSPRSSFPAILHSNDETVLEWYDATIILIWFDFIRIHGQGSRGWRDKRFKKKKKSFNEATKKMVFESGLGEWRWLNRDLDVQSECYQMDKIQNKKLVRCLIISWRVRVS